MTAIRKAISDLIETDVDDETIIVSLESGQMFAVKDTGRAVWKLIDGERDGDAIVAELSKAYGKKAAAISAGVGAFIVESEAAGLICRTEQAIANTP